jgi:hypothetical protein
MSHSVDTSFSEPQLQSFYDPMVSKSANPLSSSSAAAAATTSSSLNAVISCGCMFQFLKYLVQKMTRTAQNAQGQSTDILTQLSNLLPTGTFMLFQALATLTTNNGDCGHTDKVVTAVMLVILGAICAFSCFTDSYKAENGVVYYGVVTTTGLWNPCFVGSGLANVSGAFYIGDNAKYNLRYLFLFVCSRSAQRVQLQESCSPELRIQLLQVFEVFCFVFLLSIWELPLLPDANLVTPMIDR